jgi:hypothetical protein
MAAINIADRTIAQRIAAHRYPYIAQRKRIWGNGPYGVVSKCDGIPFIKLYNTVEERACATKRCCGSRNCSFYHIEENFA